MFSTSSSGLPLSMPSQSSSIIPNLKSQDSWTSSLVSSLSTASASQEDTPWQVDTASILLPKALLPTPGPRYCQPPPSFRSHTPHTRMTGPLFPVPPPGSCLVPPPPLAEASGMVSPHSWHDVTPNKADRWRKMSWAAGEGGAGAAPVAASPPRPATFYNYQKPLQLQARQRTLVEVPLQKKLQADTSKELQTTGQLGNPINIFQSNLDPNCRPFTPANINLPTPLSSSQSCSKAVNDGIISPFSFSKDVTAGPASLRNVESGVTSHFSSDLGLEDISDIATSFSDLPSEKSLCLSNNSGLESISSAATRFHEASKLSEDPLPEDPKMLLPQLDTSQDDCSKPEPDIARRLTPTSSTATASTWQPRFSLMGSDASLLPPPVYPFSTWSGKSRPPLLPDPYLLPYGPRQPMQPPLFEEDLSFSINSSPGRSTRSKTSAQGRSSSRAHVTPEISSTIRKPDTIDRVSSTSISRDGTPVKWRPSSLASADWLVSSSSPDRMRRSSVGSSSSKLDDWDPELGGLVAGSLIESYPVPEEYMVSRVVGGKLPNVKLHNCHTDLLFFLFYSYQEDYLQLVAARLLFERGWRYHKVDQVWLARWPGVTPEKKNVEWEEGLYQYFDVKVWRRIPGWFRLNYNQLAERSGITEHDIPLKQMWVQMTK